MDSSQMLDPDREPALKAVEQEYLRFDGFVGIHGTDTAARTARYLHINLPFYDPREMYRNNRSVYNWTKPFPLISSQESAAIFKNGRFYPNVGSDAGATLVTAVSAVTHPRFGEVGCLVNRELVLRGTAYDKATESYFNIFQGDEGIPKLAERTAFNLAFPGTPFNERSIHEDRPPFVIYGSDKYEKRVLTVSEFTHLEPYMSYLDAVQGGNADTINMLKKTLPQAVLYVSKGAGNVQKDEYEILEKVILLEGENTFVIRVPLRGGRVPPRMHYAVPGGDLPGFNIEYLTARTKAQSVLALMDDFKVPTAERKDFFVKMMGTPFGREILPYN
ncbi:asparaginase [Candidatus Woesearchaeota archaeon]|nr:asparaginase [Candidatus Woesearchaeota archaeon]